MSQSELLPVSRKVLFDRPLIAFAFLAQATQVPGDLMSGLIPIFKPIAMQRVGKKFDPGEFAYTVASLYGIKIHPWAVDDLATRLERAGLLVRTQPVAGAHEYVYANIEATFEKITEVDIRHVVDKFIDFSRPVLRRLGAPVDEKVLEDGFFEKLTAVDFHSILLKPELKEAGPFTLAMPKKEGEQDHQQDLAAKAHLDVLCAAFIVDAYHNNRALYDLIVQIATGALLLQVVLNIQDPGKTVSLLTLHVVLDAPFVMSVLDLSGEESSAYARELQSALREHEASVEVFRHSLDEIRDNLKAVISGVSQGAGFGATARRLHSPAFRAYVQGVVKDIEAAVGRAGIRIVDPPKLDSYYRHFTQEDEDFFYGLLGSFWNPVAQQRDAASIAAIMRHRQGRRTRTSALHQAQWVFVTQNPRIAECSVRLLLLRKLGGADEVPPAITDRFLAGLIWVLYGGRAAELTRYHLLASCTAALEPRNDVMAKMHRFLTGTDETKASQFRAMMTDERAGQHLMQLTLGDSLLITSTTDAEQVMSELEARLEAKHKAIAEQAVSQANAEAQERIRQAEAAREQQAQAARDATLNELAVRGELTAAQRKAERDRQEFEAKAQEKDREIARHAVESERSRHAEIKARIDERQPQFERCVVLARRAANRRHWLVSCGVGAAASGAAFMGSEYMTNLSRPYAVVGAAIAGTTALLTYGKNPDRIFGGWIRRARESRFSGLLHEYGLAGYSADFEVDWDTGEVKRSSQDIGQRAPGP